MERPRRCFALCSPIAQRMASTTLLLPQPLGPTTPVMPSSKEKTMRSANDLNPVISTRRIFIGPGVSHESRRSRKPESPRARAGDGGAFAVAEAELALCPAAAVVDADARALPQARGGSLARGDEQLRLRIAQVVAVVTQLHVERLAQVPRARRAVQEWQEPRGGRQRLRGSQQHRAGFALGAAHRVQHRVHAIDQVDVRMPGLAVHHVGPRGAPGAGVAGEVVLPDVGLGLHDAACAKSARSAPHQQAADQVGRDGERIARKERTWQGRQRQLSPARAAVGVLAAVVVHGADSADELVQAALPDHSALVEEGGHQPSRAWARSAIKSSASSSPMERRTMPSSTPARASSRGEYPVWLKRIGSEDSVSVPPRLAARATSRSRSQNANARSLVPSVNVTMPPNPLICLRASSWSACEGSPGYQTRCTSSRSQSQRATCSDVAPWRPLRSATDLSWRQ